MSIELEKPKGKNYHLGSDAVEQLANADKEAPPQYSEEELNQYRSHRGIRLPELAKLLLIKAWFAGAVCYFLFWGLGAYIGSTIDMLFVLGMGLGMVTDLLTNNVIRFLEKTPGANDPWLLVTKKGIVGFGQNLILSCVIVLGVFFLYGGINRFAVLFTKKPDELFLGVEPLLYGLFCMGFDLLLIGIKRWFGSMIRDARK